MQKPCTPPTRLKRRWLQAPVLQKFLHSLEAAGGQARVAGGAVRSSLLKEPVNDIDIATTLLPDQVMKVAEAADFKVLPIGIEHGTVRVIGGGQHFEVTTLRRDDEPDGRHAKVSFSNDWAEDAARRDFTINALYVDAGGKIYDYTDGYTDILRKSLRFVGKPRQRIAEDHLRILRFFRFLARYGVSWADLESLKACVRARSSLKQLSPERVASEMFKLLEGPHAVAALKLMAKTQVLDIVLPSTGDFRTLSRLPADGVLRAFALAKQPLLLKQRWHLSNAQGTRLQNLSAAPALTPDLKLKEQKHLLYDMGVEAWRDAVHMAWAQSRSQMTDAKWKRLLNLPKRWSLPVFPVKGGDLIARGLAPGPQLGAALKLMEDYWIAHDFKSAKADILIQLEDKT